MRRSGGVAEGAAATAATATAAAAAAAVLLKHEETQDEICSVWLQERRRAT